MVKMKEKGHSRRIRIGKYGVIGGFHTGLNEKDVIHLDIKQESDSVFIVRPKSELEDGEYCFYYNGDALEIDHVYDFTISK